MKSYLWVLAAALLVIPAVDAVPPQQAQPTMASHDVNPPAALSWAFPKPSKNQPKMAKSGAEHVPGSSKTYTAAQIDDLHNPPDWFPNEHPPMPKVVAHGAGPNVPACASCHLTSGLGHPESADLAGMPLGYIESQMADFKSGARYDPARMTVIGKAVPTADAKAAAMYFSSLKVKPWVTVKETDTVPKFYVSETRMHLPLPGAGTEPLGNRIIELPQDPSLASKRDPNSGFIAYVPKGSVAKGEALVTMGAAGKTIACNICHGSTLDGLGDVPRIAGLSPSYVGRQIYYFKAGVRTGMSVSLMTPVVQNLNNEDILNIAAYLASLKP